MAKKGLRVRIGVIVVRDGMVLLARQHVSDGRDFWIVPGGGLKRDEGLLECARREMAEETGLEVEPVRLLYVGDFFKGEKHVVDMFFLGKLVGGELKRREDEIDNLQFFEIERLKQIAIKPPALMEELITGLQEGFGPATVYIGRYFAEHRSVTEPKREPGDEGPPRGVGGVA